MGNPTTNEEVVRRYLEISVARDFDSLASLRHPDWQSLWPQSGERVVGHAHWAEIAQGYPGGVPEVSIDRLVGSEDRWFVTPGNTVARVAGTGDFWWGEWRMRYPDGKIYQCVALLELCEGLIWRETVYWADPFDPPDWRRQLVEPGNQPTG